MIKYTLKKPYDENARTILNTSEYFFVRYWSGNDYKTNVVREPDGTRVVVVEFYLEDYCLSRMAESLNQDKDLTFTDIHYKEL